MEAEVVVGWMGPCCGLVEGHGSVASVLAGTCQHDVGAGGRVVIFAAFLRSGGDIKSMGDGIFKRIVEEDGNTLGLDGGSSPGYCSYPASGAREG